jgi:hypothetical protein
MRISSSFPLESAKQFMVRFVLDRHRIRPTPALAWNSLISHSRDVVGGGAQSKLAAFSTRRLDVISNLSS